MIAFTCIPLLNFLSCYAIGGAGGKGTWGKPIDFYDEEGGHVKDSRDPNYDSDEADVSDWCHDNTMFEKMLIYLCRMILTLTRLLHLGWRLMSSKDKL